MFCDQYFEVLCNWSFLEYKTAFCKHYFGVLSILSILEYKTGVL